MRLQIFLRNYLVNFLKNNSYSDIISALSGVYLPIVHLKNLNMALIFFKLKSKKRLGSLTSSKWLGRNSHTPSKVYFRNSFAFTLGNNIKPSLYTELFYFFTAFFGHSLWRTTRNGKLNSTKRYDKRVYKTKLALLGHLLITNAAGAFLLKLKRNKVLKLIDRRESRKQKKGVWVFKNITSSKKGMRVDRVTSLNLLHKKNPTLFYKYRETPGRQSNRRFKVLRYNQLHSYLYLKENSRLFINKFVLKFKLNTTKFLKTNLNETIIKYNLKKLYRPSNYTRSRLNVKSRYSKPIFIKNTGLNKMVRGVYIKNLKRFKHRGAFRRVDMFWVSKLNQKRLTPVRRTFKELDRKYYNRQKRITKYVFRYYNFKVLEIINNLEFNIVRVMLRSGFVKYRPIVLDLINRGFIFLNGTPVTSKSITVSGSDVIQFILQLKFILFLKWNFLTIKSNTRRFFFYLQKWRRRKFRPYPKKSSYRIPNWIRTRILFNEPAPSYLETDFLTMTIVVLYDWTHDFYNYHFMSLNQESPATVRPLNWKSIT